jgi:glycogen synthase
VSLQVLMTADTVGGVWTYALELIRALAPHGVEVALATMGERLKPDQRSEARSLPNLRLFESDFKLEWMERPWEDVAAAGDWLLGLEASLRPALVHLNGYVHAALPWRAPTLVVAHSCVCSWFEAVRGHPAPEAWEEYRRQVARGIRAASLVTAPTAAMLRELSTHYGAFRTADPVPNCRAPDLFPPAGKEPLVFAAGRLWDEAKNVGALDRAAEGLPWPAYVAGDDQHPEGGRQRFSALRSVGRLAPSSLADWLGKASLFAAPARYEPFGLCALEAGLAGCALVLGDIPSLREVWGECALFVPPEDAVSLRRTLHALIRDADLRAEFARRGRDRALSYSPRRTAEGYLELYRRLLDRVRSSPMGTRLEPR